MKVMNKKEALIGSCRQILAENLKSNEVAMQDVRTAMFNETKSSAGDKFETARATLQREEERLKGSIIKIKQQEQLLKQTPLIHCSTVSPGALVSTDSGSYFISIGLGKIIYQDQAYYAISPQAPIYIAMQAKKENESFTFNGKQFEIICVE